MSNNHSSAKHTKNSGAKKAKKGSFVEIKSNFTGILQLDNKSFIEKKGILGKALLSFNKINVEFACTDYRSIETKLMKCTTLAQLEEFEISFQKWILDLIDVLYEKKSIEMRFIKLSNSSNDAKSYNIINDTTPELNIKLKQHKKRDRVPDVITWVDVSNETKGVAMMIPGLDVIETIAIEYMLLRGILDRFKINKINNFDNTKTTVEKEDFDDHKEDIPFDFEADFSSV